MRRADRLFQIIQWLRRRRLTTAAWLAERLEVSERTIYRDVRDLIASGVPIEGEAGLGYVLLRGFDLPPLMFTETEIEALVLGARFVKVWADPELARAADDLLGKVEAVIPKHLKDGVDDAALFSLNFKPEPESQARLGPLRVAIREQRKISFSYQRKDGETSERVVRPLSLAFVASLWLLTAWCELRQDFRNFRIDRMHGLTLLEVRYESEAGRNLEDYLQKVRTEQG